MENVRCYHYSNYFPVDLGQGLEVDSMLAMVMTRLAMVDWIKIGSPGYYAHVQHALAGSCYQYRCLVMIEHRDCRVM